MWCWICRCSKSSLQFFFVCFFWFWRLPYLRLSYFCCMLFSHSLLPGYLCTSERVSSAVSVLFWDGYSWNVQERNRIIWKSHSSWEVRIQMQQPGMANRSEKFPRSEPHCLPYGIEEKSLRKQNPKSSRLWRSLIGFRVYAVWLAWNHLLWSCAMFVPRNFWCLIHSNSTRIDTILL